MREPTAFGARGWQSHGNTTSPARGTARAVVAWIPIPFNVEVPNHSQTT